MRTRPRDLTYLLHAWTMMRAFLHLAFNAAVLRCRVSKTAAVYAAVLVCTSSATRPHLSLENVIFKWMPLKG